MSSSSEKEVEVHAADEEEFALNRAPFEVLNEKILGIVHSQPWAWFIAFLIFISLFLQDFSILVLPPSADIAINVIYIVMGAIFLIELIVLMTLQTEYLRADSIFMWSDLLSLASMSIDCIPLDVFARQGENSTNLLDNAINAIRILRLFRLWRIFRIFKLIQVFLNKKYTYASKLGASLSTFLAMKVGMVAIFVCAFITILKWDTAFVGPPMAIKMLETMPKFSSDFNITRNAFTKYYDNVLTIVMDNVTVYQNPNKNRTDYRKIELESFTTRRSKLFLEDSDSVRGSAAINIVLIVILLVFFFIMAYIIRSDVRNKFKKVFKNLIARIEEIGDDMGVYKSTDRQFKNPAMFYNELLTKMRDRASNTEGKTEKSTESKGKKKKKGDQGIKESSSTYD